MLEARQQKRDAITVCDCRKQKRGASFLQVRLCSAWLDSWAEVTTKALSPSQNYERPAASMRSFFWASTSGRSELVSGTIIGRCSLKAVIKAGALSKAAIATLKANPFAGRRGEQGEIRRSYRSRATPFTIV